jgi:hypothetical protein
MEPQTMRNEMAAGIDTAETTEARQVAATYATYSDAQRAVDHLSDSSFPVEHTDIVGHDLRLVEHVTGRLTKTRAAATGAGGGAWFGLFFGLIVGLFTTGPEWLGLTVGGLLIGAFAGAVYGFFAHWATRGQRDFVSAQALVADRYELMVANDYAERARALLAQLDE